MKITISSGHDYLARASGTEVEHGMDTISATAHDMLECIDARILAAESGPIASLFVYAHAHLVISFRVKHALVSMPARFKKIARATLPASSQNSPSPMTNPV